MPTLKSRFFLCLILVFLSSSSCKSRPLGTLTSLENYAAQDAHFGAHASQGSGFFELQESPRLPGRLSPEGPDPKHH
ncbi:hypothetical protein VNO77_44524 [Canavalia gladiata]|uniref:Uncharacterized protein n=1 Tax=Canavalia gladiata TaxID=3824 RepID=A0AAN9PNV5_CANGL